MSICLYKVVGSQYFYCVEVGMPEDQIQLGEADSPAGAVRAMDGTHLKSAYTSCMFPSPSSLGELFDLHLEEDQEVEIASEEEQEEAESEYARLSGEKDEDEDE